MQSQTDAVVQWFEHTVGISPVTQKHILLSLIIIVVLWALRFAVMKLVYKRTTDVRARYQWQKTTTYVSVGLAIILIGRIWF